MPPIDGAVYIIVLPYWSTVVMSRFWLSGMMSLVKELVTGLVDSAAVRKFEKVVVTLLPLMSDVVYVPPGVTEEYTTRFPY